MSTELRCVVAENESHTYFFYRDIEWLGYLKLNGAFLKNGWLFRWCSEGLDFETALVLDASVSDEDACEAVKNWFRLGMDK